MLTTPAAADGGCLWQVTGMLDDVIGCNDGMTIEMYLNYGGLILLYRTRSSIPVETKFCELHLCQSSFPVAD